MHEILRLAARWCRNARGGIAVSFAVALPVVFGMLGLASDYAMMTKVRSELQQAADSAALAGAREIPLANSNVAQITSSVRSYAAYKLMNDATATDEKLATANLSIDVQVVSSFSAVHVKISEAWTPFFMHFIDAAVTPVTVEAQARFVGRNNVCVLGLGAGSKTILLDAGSRLTGNKCGVFSNSTDKEGLFVDGDAFVKAQIICSAGGASIASSANVMPSPITDCPIVPDPLAGRAAPSYGGCDHNKFVLDSVTKTIDPGVYCGGLTIKGTANITLNPGIYVIIDGGLIVSGTASITGQGVGFYLTGAKAAPASFSQKTHISLVAPKTGPLAGLLIFEDRSISTKMQHKITSDDARVLLGTIYLPVGSLLVDAKQPVADQSAYTAIVVNSLDLNMGPNLVLNSDYDMTDVPVPAGIAGSSQVVLSN